MAGVLPEKNGHILRKIITVAGTVIGVTTLEFFLTWVAATSFRDSRVVTVLLSFLDFVHRHTHMISAWWPMTFTLGLPGIVAGVVVAFRLGRTGRERGLLYAVGLAFWVLAYVAGVLFLFILFAATSPNDRSIGR